MAFVDSAAEVLDRAEASLISLISLITDALKAKAYRDVATIAAMAEAQSGVAGRFREGQRGTTASEVAGGAADTAKAAEPSWMRPRVT